MRPKSLSPIISMLIFFVLTSGVPFAAQGQITVPIPTPGFLPDDLPPQKHGLYVQLGTDYFRFRQADVHGTSVLSLFYRTESGLFIGNTVHSGAFGQGGGFFLGGFELGWIFPFVNSSELWISGFLGGGGGAGQVPGEGMMLRPNISVMLPVFERTYLTGGLSYIYITGSPISTPALNFSIQRKLNLAIAPGHYGSMPAFRGAIIIRAFKPATRIYFPINSMKRRADQKLGNMYALGAEVGFAIRQHDEAFIQAHGVVAGDAEGYADWVLGYRRYFNMDFGKLSVAAGAGSAGGGAVNAGGGMILMAGGGLEIPLVSRFSMDIELMAIRSLNGDFMALAPGVRFVSLLEREGRTDTRFTYRWRAHSGIAIQVPNKYYRKPGSTNKKAPVMIEASMDLFLKDQFYVTGHAYTAFKGDAGGYQLGLLGAGYTYELNEYMDLSGELYLGAGGGAAIETRGGLVSGGRVNLDVPLSGYLNASIGVGKLFAIGGRGMAPWTFHAGLTIPFLTFH